MKTDGQERCSHGGRFLGNLLIMLMLLFLYVLWDVWIIHNRYVTSDFRDIGFWHLTYGSIVVASSVTLALLRRSLIMLLFPVWYIFGWGDILYYLLERGGLPERFWGVWIIGLGQYQPEAASVVTLAQVGLLLTLVLIPVWPVGSDGCLAVTIYKKIKRYRSVNRFYEKIG